MAERDKPARSSGADPGGPRVSLPRALSKLGFTSRSRAVALVREGRVTVNGRRETDPDRRVDPARDRLSVDGAPVAAAARIYLMLNKPRGVVTSAADERGRHTVYDLLPSELPWVGPVGRLDRASEGLLLLTNDSRWGDRITAPASHLEKVYHVQIDRLPDADLLAALETGVEDAGERLVARRARPLRAGSRNAWLEIVLDEGRNRQIRRMLAVLDVDVLRLVRVAVGPLALGDLPRGQQRALTVAEKEALDEALGRGRAGH
jgi:23S rRNA pseudouridine2605 synthase